MRFQQSRDECTTAPNISSLDFGNANSIGGRVCVRHRKRTKLAKTEAQFFREVTNPVDDRGILERDLD